MPLSDVARKSALDHLNASVPFRTYSGMAQAFPISVNDPTEVQETIATLNYLFHLIFPQIHCDKREELFGTFRQPTPAQFEVLEELASLILHDGLRARAYEQLWAYRADKSEPSDAIAAAQSYLQYLQTLPSPVENDILHDGTATLERALRLSAPYALNPTYTAVYLNAQQQAMQAAKDGHLSINARCVYLNLVVDTWKDVPGGVTQLTLLAHIHQLDLLQQTAGNHTWRHSLAEIREKVTAKMGAADRQASRNHFAQIRVDEGEAHATTNPIRAKQAFMDAERRYIDLNKKQEAQQMQLKGAALAPAIFAEMSSVEIDIGEYVEFCKTLAQRRLLQASSLPEYLTILAEHHAVQPKGTERDSATPLHKLFGQLHFGVNGQIVNATGQTGEPDFDLDEMQSHAQLSAILNTYLWKVIDQRWSSTEDELFALVAASPTVPPHSRTLITVGILFALHEDYLVAAAVLAPLPEEILRHTLQTMGKLAPYTDPTRVQKLTMLGSLLDLEDPLYADLQLYFGQDLMLDAKRVLDTESLNIRNTMLHGLGGDHYVQDWPGRAMIQLVIRLVFGQHPGRQGSHGI